MLGKKDNHDIFNQYKSILLEQVEDNGMNSLISRIKSSTLDQKTKIEILGLLDNPKVQDIYKQILAQTSHGEFDADAAGYASYPEATPAQDDEDTVNEPDPEFAKEMAKEREKQQKENPERY